MADKNNPSTSNYIKYVYVTNLLWGIVEKGERLRESIIPVISIVEPKALQR